MTTTLPKHFYRVQGYVDPADHHTLFDIYYCSWGVQTRIIRALFAALAKHVREHYDPHTPADERDAELEDILSRVHFGRPTRSRRVGREHESGATARPLEQDSTKAPGRSAITPELTGGEYADTQDPLGWQGPGQEKEACSQ